jgi:hypothetical protein
LVKEVACHYYNNTLGTLKQVLQVTAKELAGLEKTFVVNKTPSSARRSCLDECRRPPPKNDI